MENSENKSLISTSSSNLAKTEKLLSITQKILSEIKPQYESVRIGNQEWMTRNLDVERFRNGDLIPYIESDEECEKAIENCHPAWCYYYNNPDNGKKYGKLYNWHAVNDPRGLAPKGWHIPSDYEWDSQSEFLGDDEVFKLKAAEGWIELANENNEDQNGNGDNSTGFNALPGGYRRVDGSFLNVKYGAFFWSNTRIESNLACDSDTYDDDCNVVLGRIYTYCHDKSVGASVRCLRD